MTYVISDVHGNYERWADIKDKINLTDEDRLIVLGDVIDRGPDGIKILQEIMGASNVTMMMGNHELMMLESLSFTKEELNDPGNMDSFRNWTRNNGGQVTYEAFLALPANEQSDILEYLSKLPSRLHIEVNGRRFTLVHGFTNNEGSVEADVWSRPKGIHCPGNLSDGSMLIVGHTPVVNLMDEEDAEEAGRSNFRILHADNYIDIDCCCAYPEIKGSALGCIRLDDMSEYYSVCESKGSLGHMPVRWAEYTAMSGLSKAFRERKPDFIYITRVAEARDNSLYEHIGNIYTAKENEHIPDEYASLLLCNNYVGSSISSCTWYKLEPMGKVTRF